jgi:hypothetical protein
MLLDWLHCRLRLADRFGAKRWLTTRGLSWPLLGDGGYECERIRETSLEMELRHLVDLGNSSTGLLGFAMKSEVLRDLNMRCWAGERELVAGVMAAVQAGRLVVLQETGESKVDPAAQARTDARRISDEIDRLSRGRLICDGRRYSIHAAGGFDRAEIGLTLQIVPARETQKVVERLVRQHAQQAPLVALLQKARPLLATTPSPAEEPNLVLIRHLRAPRQNVEGDGPALTPSQMRRELGKKTAWIELEVVEADGEPYVGSVTVQLPDGGNATGSLDKDGFWGKYEIDEGECKLLFPQFAPSPKQPSSTVAAKGALGVVVTEGKGSGPKLVDANVSITGPDSKAGTSDNDGQVNFTDLAAGRYDVTVDCVGFQTLKQSVNVAADTTTSLAVSLIASKAVLAVAGVPEADKVSVGGLVVRRFDGNLAPRKKITLSMTNAGDASQLILSCAGDKVRIYDAANAGKEIKLDGTMNVFGPKALPKDLWVEGVSASDAMRDVEISASIDGRAGVKDTAKLTVLWVDTPNVALSGPISAQNAKRAGYVGWTQSGSDQLGLQLFNNTFGERMGWGSEASAVVHPTRFSFPGTNLKLERDYYFRDYANRTLLAQGNYSATLPPGNDTGPASARDDDPAPNDTIYDWDAAGLNIPHANQNTIMRTRNNFKAFASITVEGKNVRCSAVREYRIRFSQKQTAAPAGSTWQIINPPDVAGDNEASHGHTNVSWDLK